MMSGGVFQSETIIAREFNSCNQVLKFRITNTLNNSIVVCLHEPESNGPDKYPHIIYVKQTSNRRISNRFQRIPPRSDKCRGTAMSDS